MSMFQPGQAGALSVVPDWCFSNASTRFRDGTFQILQHGFELNEVSAPSWYRVGACSQVLDFSVSDVQAWFQAAACRISWLVVRGTHPGSGLECVRYPNPVLGWNISMIQPESELARAAWFQVVACHMCQLGFGLEHVKLSSQVSSWGMLVFQTRFGLEHVSPFWVCACRMFQLGFSLEHVAFPRWFRAGACSLVLSLTVWGYRWGLMRGTFGICSEPC